MHCHPETKSKVRPKKKYAQIGYASDFDPTLADSIRGIDGAIGFPLSTSWSDLWCTIHADLTYIYIDYESANSISVQSYESVVVT